MSRFQGPFAPGTEEAFAATQAQAKAAGPASRASGVIYNPSYWTTQQGQKELRTRSENQRRRQLSGLEQELGPEGQDVFEAAAPLYESGVFSERDFSRLLREGVEDAVNDRRDRFANLAAVNEDAKAIAKLQSPAQMQQATQKLIKEYGPGVVNQTEAGQRLLGTTAEIQRRKAQQQAEKEARIRQGMQRFGMDPDTMLGLDKQGKPIYSINPSDQRQLIETQAKLQQEERTGSLEEQRYFHDKLEQLRKNKPEFDEFKVRTELANAGVEKSDMETQLVDRHRQFEQEMMEYRAQEEEYARRAFGMDFQSATEPFEDTALGPVPQQRVFDIVETEKPEVPTFNNGEGAEAAFAAGKIEPFTPFRINGVLVEFDENGQARRVQ